MRSRGPPAVQVPWCQQNTWQVHAMVTVEKLRPDLPADIGGTPGGTFGGISEYLGLMAGCWAQVRTRSHCFLVDQGICCECGLPCVHVLLQFIYCEVLRIAAMWWRCLAVEFLSHLSFTALPCPAVPG